MTNLLSNIEKFMKNVCESICYSIEGPRILNPCKKQNFPQFEKILKERCVGAKVELMPCDDEIPYKVVYWPNSYSYITLALIFADGDLSISGEHIYPHSVEDWYKFADAINIKIADKMKQHAFEQQVNQLMKRRTKKMKIVLDGLHND